MAGSAIAESVPEVAGSAVAESVPAAENEPVAYRVSFVVTGDPAVHSLLERVSLTYKEMESPSPSLVLLRGQTTADRKRLLKALRSEGYFAAVVNVRFAEAKLPDEPIHLLFEVDSGPLYTLHNPSIQIHAANSASNTPLQNQEQGQGQEQESTHVPPPPEKLGLIQGGPARSNQVRQSDKALLQHAQAQGHPFATLLPRRVIVDHATHTMQVTLHLRPGPRARMGTVSWQGLQTVKPEFVQQQLLWKAGDLYQPALLERTRNALLATGLFAMVDLQPAAALETDGSLPVTITVQERLQRTLSLGAGVSSDEGPKINLGWEHRNLQGGGEHLATQVEYGQVRKRFKSNFGKPHFGRRDQTLLMELITENENVEAYQKQSVTLQSGLERTYEQGWRLSLGASYRLAELFTGDSHTPDGTGTFGLVSLPFRATLDHSDDLLNPTRGWRLNAFFSPLLDTLENGHSFTKLHLQITGYRPVTDAPRLVVAGRIKAGILTGSNRSEVPVDERYYAGGSGSLRGYAYQLVGPLDSSDKPLGGRSLLESSLEARVQVRESLEMVLFLDEGAVMKSPVPDLSERPYFGLGSGIRYLTPIGPLRLDVAFPLDQRPNIDKSVQLSASIGQAF
ncbi:MAG: autotransporter assembly complex protein TamA [Magnetococcus sp. DMHC-1]